jgi:hypothetical protein
MKDLSKRKVAFLDDCTKVSQICLSVVLNVRINIIRNNMNQIQSQENPKSRKEHNISNKKASIEQPKETEQQTIWNYV